MKALSMMAVAALASGATVSFASELYHPSNAEEGVSLRPGHMKGALTREQVEQEVLAAQRDGTLTWIGRGYPPNFPVVSAPKIDKSTEQVARELRQWKQLPVRPDGARMVPGVGWVAPEAP